jgi:CzcA family heavy metal efflux pump
MIAWLVQHALRQRLVVVVLSAVFVVVAFPLMRKAHLDVFPEFAPPLVEIQTEAPGLSAPEVERLVTMPLESALNGTPWVKTMRSKSVLGLSSVVLLFEPGTELTKARQLVSERLHSIGQQLPTLAHPPIVLASLSSLSRMLKVGISSNHLSQMEMTTLARWTIRPRLMAIPGVANVAIWGQRDRQFQIIVDPVRLAAHKVRLDEVVKAATDGTLPEGGGFVDTANQRLAISQRQGVNNLDDLASLPIAIRKGAALKLGDVAQIVEGHPAPIGDAIVNDGPGLLLIVEKQPGGNTLEVTREVERVLEELRPGLPGLDIDPTIFRPATYIEMSLDNLQRAFLIGCLLVIAVLFFFLWDWRTAAISVVAIPLSLLGAAITLHLRGESFNVMVLAGLVIALGEVVDDAIIDVENIVRRLRENASKPNPSRAIDVVFNASLEVRSAVVYATLIVALVFVPVFMLDGLAGAFFRPLATSYLLAVGASLLVALIVTPALSLIFLGRGSLERKEPPLLAPLRRTYRSLLERFLNNRWLTGSILAAAAFLSVVIVPFLGENFLPQFKERDFLMHWVEKPGASLEASSRVTLAASKELRTVPGVRNFGSHIGRAEVADEVVGPNFTELWISLDPSADYDSSVSKLQEVVDGYPGLYRDLLTYLRERVKEVLTGAGASVVVRIYGPDLEQLRSKANEVAKAVANVPGVSDLKVEPQVDVPQLEVNVRRNIAERFGLTPSDVRRSATILFRGTKVGQIVQEQVPIDVVVWGSPELRHDPTSIASIKIDAAAGGQVSLGDVADVSVGLAPNIIQREGASRRLDVTCNVRGKDLGTVAKEIESRVRALRFAPGYHPEFLGEYAATRESRRQLFFFGLLALVGIFLVLHSDFGSLRLAILVFMSLPFALVGGLLGAALSGGVLSLGSLVGFVTVIGIAARNGIMLVSHFRHLEQEEGVPFGLTLVLQGAEERLAPILMTALATGLALVPIIIGGSRPGHEIEHPLAVVIVGGLLSSTLMNLLMLPGLYLRFCKSRSTALP